MSSLSFNRKAICSIYLILAFLGLLLPTLANIDFVRTYGGTFDLINFISLANSNPASQSLSRDLLIGSSAIFFWMCIEAKRLKIKYFWFIILTTFLIAFAFSTPMFLLFRELRLQQIEDQNNP